MNYLYHWVPKDMKGDVLYPLNTLKVEYPDLYSEYIKNYAGREIVLEHVIPTLNCLWNDVLHLTAVHPKDIKDALIQSGRKIEFKMTCYQIDPNLLDPKNTTVFLYKRLIRGKMDEDDFASYDPNNIEQYSHIPQETNDYYSESFIKKEKPMVFHKIAHILHRGPVNIKDCLTIEV